MITHLIVIGKVQGVFYRQSTQKKALELEIKGWIKNLEDGSVEIMAEGNKIPEFVSWCHKGPTLAKVDSIRREEIELKLNDGFEIR